MAKEIDHPILRDATATEVTQLQNFVSAASTGIPGAINTGNPNSKVYFIAFDGTGNNKYNPDLAPTNVTKLYELADKGLDASQAGRGNKWGQTTFFELSKSVPRSSL